MQGQRNNNNFKKNINVIKLCLFENVFSRDENGYLKIHIGRKNNIPS